MIMLILPFRSCSKSNCRLQPGCELLSQGCTFSLSHWCTIISAAGPKIGPKQCHSSIYNCHLAQHQCVSVSNNSSANIVNPQMQSGKMMLLDLSAELIREAEESLLALVQRAEQILDDLKLTLDVLTFSQSKHPVSQGCTRQHTLASRPSDFLGRKPSGRALAALYSRSNPVVWV
jgi:hypothetical protein